MPKCSDCGKQVPDTPGHSARFSSVKCPDCERKSTEHWDDVERFERRIRNTNETLKTAPYPGEPPEATRPEGKK